MPRQDAQDRPETLVTMRQRRWVSYIRRYPIAAFFIWFFTIGQTIVFMPVLLHKSGVAVSTEPFIIAGTWVGMLLPVLAIRCVLDGRVGIRRLLTDALRAGVSLRWYLLAVLAVPVGIVGLHWALEGAPQATAGDWVSALAVGLVLNTVVVFATVNWAEEVVWTGFVQRTLQSRGWSPMRAAVATAPFFALGHISLVVGGGFASGVTLMLLMALLSIPFRALQGWIYNRTRSLVVPGLVHAAGNATALGSLAAPGLMPRLYGIEGQSVLAFAALGLVAIGLTRGRLGRASTPSQHISDPNASVPWTR